MSDDRSKDALDASLAALERTFDAAGQGAVAFNRKIIDIAQRNVNSGFDLAKSLAGAKSLPETLKSGSGRSDGLGALPASEARGDRRSFIRRLGKGAAHPLRRWRRLRSDLRAVELSRIPWPIRAALR